MEKLNLYFNNSFNTIKSLLWILSILSWGFFNAAGWASIKYFIDNNTIWTIQKVNSQEYYPLQLNVVFIYIIFIVTMVFGIIGFVMYLLKSIFLKDNSFFEGMMGIWPRLHSFPLIIVSFLFLLGEYFYPYYLDKYIDIDYAKFYNHMIEIRIFGLTFSLIALISLIFIYYVTDLKENPWYVVLSTKKGAYSCLITLLWYYFFFTIYQVIEIEYPSMSEGFTIFWKKFCGIFFSILIGLGSLFFSFFFKDIVVAAMNILIYLGMSIHFFSITKIRRWYFYDNEWADGIIDIVMIVISAGMLIFLLIKYRKECFASSFEE